LGFSQDLKKNTKKTKHATSKLFKGNFCQTSHSTPQNLEELTKDPTQKKKRTMSSKVLIYKVDLARDIKQCVQTILKNPEIQPIRVVMINNILTQNSPLNSKKRID
jgi:hypothetical protein